LPISGRFLWLPMPILGRKDFIWLIIDASMPMHYFARHL
jgi:hypothetical protein